MKEQLIFGGIGFFIALLTVLVLTLLVKVVQRFRRKEKKVVERNIFDFDVQPVKESVPVVTQTVPTRNVVDTNKEVLLKDVIGNLGFLKDYAEFDIELDFNSRKEPVVKDAYVTIIRDESGKESGSKDKK